MHSCIVPFYKLRSFQGAKILLAKRDRCIRLHATVVAVNNAARIAVSATPILS